MPMVKEDLGFLSLAGWPGVPDSDFPHPPIKSAALTSVTN
jgi:hypothetical protein